MQMEDFKYATFENDIAEMLSKDDASKNPSSSLSIAHDHSSSNMKLNPNKNASSILDSSRMKEASVLENMAEIS